MHTTNITKFPIYALGILIFDKTAYIHTLFKYIYILITLM